MSQQSLKAFGAKLAEDQNLRDEMNRALSQDGVKSTASLEEVAAFAKRHGYDLNPEEIRETMQLSDDDLESVAGGIIGPVDQTSFTLQSYNISSLSLNFQKLAF